MAQRDMVTIICILTLVVHSLPMQEMDNHRNDDVVYGNQDEANIVFFGHLFLLR